MINKKNSVQLYHYFVLGCYKIFLLYYRWDMSYSLQARLKECLQTVLDFEIQLEEQNMETSFTAELALFKDFVQKIDVITLSEEDVYRIESIVERVLLEFSDIPLYSFPKLVQ